MQVAAVWGVISCSPVDVVSTFQTNLLFPSCDFHPSAQVHYFLLGHVQTYERLYPITC